MKSFKTIKGLKNYAKRNGYRIEQEQSYNAEQSSYVFDGVCYSGSADIFVAYADFNIAKAYFRGR